MRAPSTAAIALGEHRPTMDVTRARTLAESLHQGDLEADGTPVICHVQRVALTVPANARVVAWLHDALESRLVSEQELLMEGLTMVELRALRLLSRTGDARSDDVYFAHLELIGRAAGDSGRLARMVKIADLEDRCLYPRARADDWTPPYADGLDFLLDLHESGVNGPPPPADHGPEARA
jgi:hypothetical protein